MNRSNPLPIHQFPSLIDEVAKLKELAANSKNATWITETGEYRYEVDILNAAPGLLAVLGGFRAGDAEIFETLIDYLESNHGGTEYEDVELSAMRRYRDMAQAMEGSQ